MRDKKRAQSEIITTVLIILLVLAAIIIVWNVVKRTVVTGTEGIGTSAFTTNLEIQDVRLWVTGGAEIKVKRGAGAGEINSLKFIFEKADGETEIIARKAPDYEMPDELETKVYDFTPEEVNEKIERVSLVPVFGSRAGIEVKEAESQIKKDAEGNRIYDAPEWLLGVESNPGLSCSHINSSGSSVFHFLPDGSSTKDGVYWIDPDGTGGNNPFQAYCDMTTDGGGWTLAFMCFPYGISCYNSNKIGSSFPILEDTDTTKFSDDIIRTLLNNGEKTTRTQWWHTSKVSGAVWAAGNLNDRGSQWNLFENPTSWSSNLLSTGQRFKRKWGSSGSWTDWMTSASVGCGGAVGGWSNYFGDSCTQSWFAGCEGGPAINHNCANGQDRADKLIVWAR